MEKLPEQLITDYSRKFFGYGHWGAPIWFVGIEEGGGGNIQAVHDRLDAWAELGRKKELVDAPNFYPAPNHNAWHQANASLQSTWKQLIRMLLIARGLDDTEDAILSYQRTKLGTETGETCIAELFPLPSPNLQNWNYQEWSDLPWLQTRRAYEEEILKLRISLICKRIDYHHPRAVVFYGDGQLKHWCQIMGHGNYSRPIPSTLISHERDGIAFFVAKHPTSPNLRPATDGYFRKIGQFFHDNHGSRFMPSN